MSKQPPPAPTTSTVGPCPTIIQISRTPRHWKFTQHHRTTRPPLGEKGKMRVKMSKQPPPAPTVSAVGPCPTVIQIVGRHWKFTQYHRTTPLPERGRKKREMIDESINVQTTPTRTHCKHSRPLPYCNPH